MKAFGVSLLSCLIAFHFFSCKKESIAVLDFTKYTITDGACVATETDNSDWTTDTAWTTQESALLAFNDDDIVLVDSVIGNVAISPACPNPSDGFFTLTVTTERECKLKMACVNTEMETLYYHARKLSGGLTSIEFDLRSLTSFHKDDYYRLYYAFYNSTDSLYYRGHGDFRIQ